MRGRCVILLLLITVLSPSGSWAGKLARARSGARGSDSQDADRDSGKLAKARSKVRRDRERDEHHDHESHDHFRQHAHNAGRLGYSFSSFESSCPPRVVETHIYQAMAPPDTPAAATFDRRFPAYPYADFCNGCMLTASAGDDLGHGKEWSGRIQFELGSDFDGVDRSGVAALLEGTHGFGLDFEWDAYTEEVSGGGYDELHVGQFNLLYRIVESDYALVRIGVGAAWLGDRYETDSGVNFTLQADYMPRRPCVLSGEFDFGTLGDAQTLHARGTAGVMVGRCELYGGYDYRRIGEVEINGPMVGLRIWY